jgi:hypothetical protein
MDFAKVVCHLEQGKRMTMICQLVRKAKTNARKMSVKRPDTQIEAFYVGGANLVYIGKIYDSFEFDASAMRLAITMIGVNAAPTNFTAAFSINFLHHGKVETAKQMRAECRNIRLPAVTSDLNHAINPLGQIRNEVIGVLIITLARQMRDNQLRAAVYARKCVEVAVQFIFRRCAALTNPDPRPKFVELN